MKSKHQEIADAWVECSKAWTERDEAVKSLAAVTAERDAYLETIRATFRALESRGQAPDDNAPLSVTVRRVLDYLDKVTAQRDALAEQLAALKQRIVDAGKTEARWFGDFDVDVFVVNCIVPEGGTYALVRLENGE